MQRFRGIVLLLIGALLFLVSAAFLYFIYVAIAGGWWSQLLLRVLFAAVLIALAVFVLRRSAQTLAFGRAAFAGALVGGGVVILLGVVGLVLNSERSPRTRQKKTMSEMRDIAAALEARAEVEKTYPPVADVQRLAPYLARYLAPRYNQTLPQRDHWGHPLRYEWQGPAAAPDGYAIGSAGRDGIWQRPHLRDYTELRTNSFDDDIVFRNGGFVQYPDPGVGPH